MRRIAVALVGCLVATSAFAAARYYQGPTGGGIPQLTGDCTAGPGLGAQAITCTKTNGSAFGTAATKATGTSGATVPLLNATNSWSAAQRATPVTITISTATFTPNFDNGQNFTLTLDHSACPCTLANPSTTLAGGQSGIIEIHQSATGSDTIGTWGSDYVVAGGTAGITLSSGVSQVDYLPYYVNAAGTAIVLGSLISNPTH